MALCCMTLSCIFGVLCCCRINLGPVVSLMVLCDGEESKVPKTLAQYCIDAYIVCKLYSILNKTNF